MDQVSIGMGDYWREEDGTLCSAPKNKYIEKMKETYFQLFGEQPHFKKSPMEPNAHPELDNSEFCNDVGTKIYHSLIGDVQWAVSLGRIDIMVHVMTHGSFRIQPRKGHFEIALRHHLM